MMDLIGTIAACATILAAAIPAVRYVMNRRRRGDSKETRRKIGRLLTTLILDGADRAYILERFTDRPVLDRFEINYEELRAGLASLKNQGRSISVTEIQPFLDKLQNGKVIAIDCVSELPESSLKQVLRDNGVESVAACGIWQMNSMIGFVATDWIARKAIDDGTKTKLQRASMELAYYLGLKYIMP